MLQLSNKSKQADNDFRITSEWKYEKNKITSYIRAAYFNEALVYSDAIYHLADTSRSESIITEAEAKINLSHFNSVNIGINNTFVNGITSGYSGNRHQNRTAFFASYSYASKNEKLKTNISGRLEFLQNVFAPFTFSLGADYQFTKWLTGKTNIAKVYRVPTFNDLYWVPGGNQNLLPENGYSEDAGLNFHFKNKTIAFTTDVAVFNRSIKNWIIWLPGISYWKPQNIKDVWSRGIETNNTFSIKIRKAKISFSMLKSYVVSTNEQLTSGNDASKGKQLIYVPMYSGMAKVSLEYHDFILSYRHNYTGYRYTAADNTQFLNPYDLGSAYVSCKIPMKNTSANFFFQANNIWNKEYQVLLNRAMPQQNFTAGISFEFNQPNK